MSRVYKVVQTDDGPSIAHLHLPEDAAAVLPDTDDSRLRASALVPTYIENLTDTGWGPVDGRTIYRIGERTEAPTIDRDESTVSGAGLHAFRERSDAEAWMEHAEI